VGNSVIQAMMGDKLLLAVSEVAYRALELPQPNPLLMGEAWSWPMMMAFQESRMSTLVCCLQTSSSRPEIEYISLMERCWVF
jgi:hypothetical protein